MVRNGSAASRQKALKQGVVRPRDVAGKGFSRTRLERMTRAGELERVGRGLYVPMKATITEHHTLVQAAARVPHGIVCLLSALRFHGVGTQSPHEVWLAVDRKARKPVVDWPPIHLVRFSGDALTFGVQTHVLEGVSVKITSRERTVADCFKYRNKIGLDVALEALREAWHAKRMTSEDIWRYAKICRVANVMRPYLDSLT